MFNSTDKKSLDTTEMNFLTLNMPGMLHTCNPAFNWDIFWDILEDKWILH